MARHELILTEGEYGFDYDFNVLKEDRTAHPMTGFTAARLVIADEETGEVKLDNTANVTLPGGNVVRWAIQNGQTDFNGTYIATIHLTGTGVLEKIVQFSVVMNKKLV